MSCYTRESCWLLSIFCLVFHVRVAGDCLVIHVLVVCYSLVIHVGVASYCRIIHMRVAGCCLIIHVRVPGNHLTDALITSNDKGISFEDSPLQENNYRTSRLNFKPELQSPFPSEL